MEDLQTPDRMEMLKKFDQTQAGVKALSDSGIQKLPRIFVRPHEELSQELTHSHNKSQIQVPLIDLSGFQDTARRQHVVEQVRIASETWGFFQVVNHGIPQSVLDDMIDGVGKFNEHDVEMKKKYYSRDPAKTVRFASSFDLFTSRTASWRDSLAISIQGSDEGIDPNELPTPGIIPEYSKHVQILGNVLLGLLSEALGLKTCHLENMECNKGHLLVCHYYPACPQPNLAVGITRHTDAGFLTILLQNQISSGLQVLHHGQWMDIRPIPGGLVVNIGDLLQLVSNGKFQSVEHRAIANRVGPRISVACFFGGPLNNAEKTYGVVGELISEKNSAVYKEVVLGEYLKKFFTTGLDCYRALDYCKV